MAVDVASGHLKDRTASGQQEELVSVHERAQALGQVVGHDAANLFPRGRSVS